MRRTRKTKKTKKTKQRVMRGGAAAGAVIGRAPSTKPKPNARKSLKLPHFKIDDWPKDFGCTDTDRHIVTLHPGTRLDRIGFIGPTSDFVALYSMDAAGNPAPLPYTARSISTVGPTEIPYVNTNATTGKNTQQNAREFLYNKLTSSKTNTAHELSHTIEITQDIPNVLICKIAPFFDFPAKPINGFQAKLPFPIKELEKQGKLVISPNDAPPWNAPLINSTPPPNITRYTRTGVVESIEENGRIHVVPLDVAQPPYVIEKYKAP